MQPTGLPVVVRMPPAVAPTSDEKTWAMLAHFLNIAFPLLAPLVIYLVRKDSSQYVAFHALEATWLGVAGVVVSMVTCGLGWVAMVIFAIVAGIKVNSGEYYEVPLAGKLARESVYGK
jgi:uncharacterized Tic20 family protein